MDICRFSIVRPVVTIVLTLLVLIFGFISLNRLPVREFPDIDVPTISISTTYTGASASVVETKITQIIEDSVSGIDGLDTIESISRDGRSRITLEFGVERDIDAAANDVRDRVSRAQRRLPDDVDPPTVAKYDSSGTPVLIIGIRSDRMTRMELTDYADRYLCDRFSVIDGVADVAVYGGQVQSMRIWLKRREMAARNVTVNDVINVLRSENVEYPGGRLESEDVEFTVKVNRQYFTPDDFRSMVIRRADDGAIIRLGDVATVNLEARSLRDSFESDGEPMVSIGISKQSTANALSVAQKARALLEEIQENLPEGMSLVIRRDEAVFIEASVKEVEESLIISAILVFLIIYIFLGNLRAALIPTLTIPIAIVGSFIILYVFGYSINMLTLLALVLAIGMVVDDAIVVLENIHRRIENNEPPMLAAARGSSQVIFAVIATTLVLAAVFLPLCLWQGKTGKMFTEFAVAITGAVIFSSGVALTLTPMLCSKLLRKQEKPGLMNRIVDWTMAKMESIYDKVLRTTAKAPLLSIAVFAAISIVVVWCWQILPGEYEPVEDRGSIRGRMTAPEGTGFYRMFDAAKKVEAAMQPEIQKGDIRTYMVYVPGFGNSDGPVNSGMLMFELIPWDQRTTTSRQIMNQLRNLTAASTDLSIQWQLPMGLSSSRGAPIQFVLGGPDYDELVKWRDIMLAKAAAYPGIQDIDHDYKETTPQMRVDIDRDRAGELGVSSSDIGAALETMLGSKQVTTFVDRGQEYDVVLQADRENRSSTADLNNIYIRSTRSTLVPLDNLVKLKEVGDAGKLNRYNRVRAITLSGNPAPGYTLSQALEFLENTVRTDLPEYAQIGYKGQSKDFKESTGSMLFIFVLALAVSYLVLAAQFESFISPFIVMLTVPLGMFGALLALVLSGQTMNIYSQIGIIMLIGLAAKNGILIVEFANQLRDKGLPFEEALFTASKLRIRPILMTGISTVIGAIPLLLASGAGAASRQTLGSVVVWGGFSACVLTLIVVPMGYLLLARREKPPMENLRNLQAEEARHPNEEI
ncbi:MAG: efflux RND transporter permease subunit [Lentisphaeria bacterium]|nr:efflux RND transporter permease subunit [Lentisphaeria bacterium]